MYALAALPNAGGVADFFPAKFSFFGPSVGVCAPGVAILSCVPGGYAAWDGTSMATRHVTGLAALVIAHHPFFQSAAGKQRNGARVEQLFQFLRGGATQVVADAPRGAAGMPTVRALAGAATGIAGVGSGSSLNGAIRAPIVLNGGFAGANGGGVDQQTLLGVMQNAQVLSQIAQLQRLAQLRSLGLI